MLRRPALVLVFCATIAHAFSVDSLFEPIMRPFDFLPEYYLRFELSTFALHQDSFYKRQYLAEPHPELEFCFISYKDLVASVWDADFQFGLGQVKGNNVFTVLNVAFGYNPKIEVRLQDVTLSAGFPHRCFHEIDRSDFPIVYYNKCEIAARSPQARVNDYWSTMVADSSFSPRSRLAWQVTGARYLRDFGGLADPAKVNGNNPKVWETTGICRYGFYRRQSWIFSIRQEVAAGTFSRAEGYYASSGTGWYWSAALGAEAFFTRGARGGCLYALYHLDDLPRAPVAPSFTLGNARFSKNGLLEIGVSFFN